MDISLSRRLLPWTLLTALAVASALFYHRAPRGEFEFDLRDSRMAESSALGLYQRIAMTRQSGCGPSVKVVFVTSSGRQVEEFRVEVIMIGDPFCVQAVGAGARVNDEAVSLGEYRNRLREFVEAARSIESQAVAAVLPPECTLREWAEFLQAGRNQILWVISPL